MKTVFVSVPFEGHIGVLARAAIALSDSVREAQVDFIVCGWPNVSISDEVREQLKQLHRYSILETKQDLKSSNPISFNVDRARELLWLSFDRELAKLGHIDHIVYDYFAIEAVAYARKNKIPTTCSLAGFVPAVRTPARKIEFMPLMELGAAVHLDECERISDGLFIRYPGLRIWCYQPEALFPKQRYLAWPNTKIDFVPERVERKAQTADTVLICFGTVVTGNLWETNSPIRSIIVALLSRLITCVANTKTPAPNPFSNPFDVLSCWLGVDHIRRIMVVTPSRKQELEKRVMAQVGSTDVKVEWHEKINQNEVLQSGVVHSFITHGGCSSVRESVLAQVPMWVIPWFGDQHAVACRVKELNWGDCSLYPDFGDNIITTERSNWVRPDLDSLESVNDAWNTFLENRDGYKHTLSQMQKEITRPEAFFQNWMSNQNAAVAWKEGDLLFGTNADRALFACTYDEKAFHLCDMRPFSELYNLKEGQQPRLIDQYHDKLIRHPEVEIQHLLLAKYKEWLYADTKTRLAPLGRLPTITEIEDDKDNKEGMQTLWGMCARAIEFFIQQGSTIHFAIGPNFQFGRNQATTLELQAARKLWGNIMFLFLERLKFYVYAQTGSGEYHWQHVKNPSTFFWFGAKYEIAKPMMMRVEQEFKRMHVLIQQHQQTCVDFLPFEFHARVKSSKSIMEKVGFRKIPVDDLIGFRITHPFTANLFRLAKRLMEDRQLRIRRKIITERRRVIYLLGSSNGIRFEIQLWPSVLYTMFAVEHARIYKPPARTITEIDNKTSEYVRELEHQMQDELDETLAHDIVLQAQFRE